MARRGTRAGLSRDEMEHVALLGIMTVGWPAASLTVTSAIVVEFRQAALAAEPR